MADTYRRFGLTTIQFEAVEIEATVTPFDNRRGHTRPPRRQTPGMEVHYREMNSKSHPSLEEAERHTLAALKAISVLRQLAEHLELTAANSILDELVGLAKAQRRAVNAALRRLKDDPLLAHLETRATSRQPEFASGRKRGQLVRDSFFIAQRKGFTDQIHDWGCLLAICPR